jgi:hypothetical protein
LISSTERSPSDDSLSIEDLDPGWTRLSREFVGKNCVFRGGEFFEIVFVARCRYQCCTPSQESSRTACVIAVKMRDREVANRFIWNCLFDLLNKSFAWLVAACLRVSGNSFECRMLRGCFNCENEIFELDKHWIESAGGEDVDPFGDLRRFVERH